MFNPNSRNTGFKLWTLVVFLFCYVVAYPQQVTDNQIKTGYIYNFLKYIQWENEEKTDTFKIAVYGEDYALINTLKSMELQQVKGKPIRVIIFKSIGDIEFAHILLITNDRNFFVKDILDLFKGRNTLLVTDRCDYPRYVMINFTYNNNSKIQFEINSQNMEEARLKTSPKLILIGGSEIDVRKLYLETEKSLITEKGKVSTYEKELTQKKEEIQNMNTKLHQLYKEIESLQGKIAIQKNDLTNVTNQSQEQQKNLLAKSLILNNQKKEIENREKQLINRDREIFLKQQKIENYSQVLNSQKAEIGKRQATIVRQGEVLNSQIARIKTQQTFLYLLIAVVLMAFTLIFVIYRNYINNREKNREIQRQSAELFEQTEQLRELNKELELKKNILEDALKKLKNTQTQLVESEKMIILGQLTSGIAHEINNPINFINSGIDGIKMTFEQLLILLNKYEDVTADNVDNQLKAISAYKLEIDYPNLLTDINQLTRDVKSGIYRTVEIIKGLRTFSRLDESDLKLIDLHKSIESTLVIVRNKFDNRIKVVKDFGDIPEIECYPGKINQVFLNIIVNAVQAIKGVGEISIKTKLKKIDDQEFVEILIKDSGMGMTDEIKKRIFEPFFTTKDAGEGTGLGMSITHNIIEIHNGSIAVESKPGLGSVFTILLPVSLNKKNMGSFNIATK